MLNEQNMTFCDCVYSPLSNLFIFLPYHPLRLHEFDEQVSAVREGMACVVPVPLLSLFTGYELETMVSDFTALPD